MKINTDFFYFENKLMFNQLDFYYNNHDNNATLKIKIPYIFTEIMA